MQSNIYSQSIQAYIPDRGGVDCTEHTYMNLGSPSLISLKSFRDRDWGVIFFFFAANEQKLYTVALN